MTKPNVAVTIRSFNANSPAMAKLQLACNITSFNNTGRHLTEDELIEAVVGAQAILAGTETYSEKVLSSSEELAIISRVGVGIDNIDLLAANENNIKVCNTPESPAQAVAEHTVALIFSCLKMIPDYNERLHRGDHSTRRSGLLSAQTVGVIGLGRIGFKAAEILSAIGCKIIYYDPYLNRMVPDSWICAEELNQLLSSSDIISLHMPPQPGNRPILDRQAFPACKKGVVIINTARGSLIDENELLSSLQDGTVSTAGLDVVQHEPVTGPLLEYPQVIVTPHVASNTKESREQMEMEAVENIINFFKRGK